MIKERAAAAARATLKDILRSEYVAITLDKWTSIMDTQYLGVTIHFISEDWSIEKICLQCLPTSSDRSTAEDIIHDVKEAIKEYLDLEQIVAVVTDTEATMNKFGRIIKEKWSTDWIGCACDIIEITTGLAFKEAGDVEQKAALDAARKLVGYYRKSTQKMDALIAKQTIVGSNRTQQSAVALRPIEDVSTRWWSTYTMTERLCKLKPYMEALFQEGQSAMNLSADQWCYISNLSTCLKPFMEAQKAFEGEKYVTISFVPVIVECIRQHLLDWIEDNTVSNASRDKARKLFKDFTEEWGTGNPGSVLTEHLTEGRRSRQKGLQPAHFMACALDPRTRDLLGIPEQEHSNLWEFVTNRIVDFLMHSKEITRKESTATTPSSHTVDLTKEDGDEGEMSAIDKMRRKRSRRESTTSAMQSTSTAAAIPIDENATSSLSSQINTNTATTELLIKNKLQNEILRFTSEPPLQSKENPLLWWKQNASTYPLLAKAARRWLCVPATSAPVERLFSVAGRVIEERRSRLEPFLVDDIVFLHESFTTLRRLDPNDKRNAKKQK
jgi:hypothetical protein